MTGSSPCIVAAPSCLWPPWPQPCPGNPQALGTERVLAVDAATTPRVGRKQFPGTLPLAPKELVLTFDDGPWPTTTPKVLDALKHECVQATFFLLGRNVAGASRRSPGASWPKATASAITVSRTRCSAACRSPRPKPRSTAASRPTSCALWPAEQRPATPFFRFPGFAPSPALLAYLQDRGIVVFGADVWASDWLPMTPDQELHLLLSRIDKSAAASCCCTTPRRRPPACCRPSCAR